MMIFAGGVYVSENTSQAASVEFVGHRHTNDARSRLQALCLKIPWIFRHRKAASHRRRLFFTFSLPPPTQ